MTNKKAYEEAKEFIIGGVNSPVRAFLSVDSTPFFTKKGEGAYLIDIEDNRYLDFVLSWGPLIFGHADRDILNSLENAIKNGISFGTPTLLETSLAKLILKDFDYLEKIRFVSSGTEALMSAIRLARGYTKKDKIIKFNGCYHGHSDSLLVSAGSGALTFSTPNSAGVPNDFAKNTFVAEFNDFNSVKRIVEQNKDEIACIVIEPIAGNMGLVLGDGEFLLNLRELCTKEGILLIFDEVMSGYRASRLGSFGIYNIMADIVTFGKVIGGGLNVAAFASSTKIMNHLSPIGDVYQAGTLSGNPIAMSAGIAMIEKIQNSKNLYEKLSEISNYFIQGLKEIAKKFGIKFQANSVGSMFGYFFTDKEVKNFNDAKSSNLEHFKKFHNSMLNQGVFLAPSQFESGFVCDKMSQKDIEFALNCAYNAFKELK